MSPTIESHSEGTNAKFTEKKALKLWVSTLIVTWSKSAMYVQLTSVLLCNSIKETITPWMLLYCSGLAALGSLSKEVHSVAFQVETIKQTLMSHCYVLFNPVTICQCCTIYAYVTFIVSKNQIKKYKTCFNHVLKE